MSDKTYNGWSNYETWCVNLWLSNDEGSYKSTQHLVRSVIVDVETDGFDSFDTLQKCAKGRLADALQAEVCEGLPDLGASMAQDMLNAAMCEVNWREIAANLLSDEWAECRKEWEENKAALEKEG